MSHSCSLCLLECIHSHVSKFRLNKVHYQMSKYIYTSIHVRETLLLVTMQLSKVNSLRVYIEEVTAPHTQCFLCNILYVHVCHIR